VVRVQPWLVVLALAGGTLVGAGQAGDQQVGDRSVRTVEVTAKRTLLSAAASPAVGGGFVSGGELYDAQGRAKVGEGFSHCGVVSVSVAVPPAVTTHCTSVFRLADGELHLSGMRTYKTLAAGFDDTAVAVTGGTGKYANVRGEGKVTRAASRAEVTYRYAFTLLEV
jgi:hypothetical protein